MLEKVIMGKVTSEIKELGIPQHKAEDVINSLKMFYGAVKNKDYVHAKNLWARVCHIVNEELEKRTKAK